MKAVILNNIRSAHNVGSILRTAEFFGFDSVYFVGVTPYPSLPDDKRLPHIRTKLDRLINKVSLGAENNLQMVHFDDLTELIKKIKSEDVQIIALEQDESSIDIYDLMQDGAHGSQHPALRMADPGFALILGEETQGLTKDELALADLILEIPRLGKKESLNVSVAFGVAAALSTP